MSERTASKANRMQETLLIFGVPLAIAMLGFAALWPLSVVWRDVSVVDILWGLGFAGQLLIAVWVLPTIGAHGWIVLALVGVWSLRLTVVLVRRRSRHGGEDARYQSIRQSWGDSFWWKSFFIVFLLQAVVQWLIAVGPIAVLSAEAAPPEILAWAGVVIALAGLGLETIADQQLDTFKRTASDGELCTTGLRAHVRHPNYVGEMVFWAGISLVGLDADAWLALLSPVLLFVFLTRISGAPLLDERLEASRPAYAAYRKRVPGFLPRWIPGTR